jgi:hypothetical protein
MVSHGQTTGSGVDAGGEAGRLRMPPALRWALFGAVALLLGGALYLIAVRGEALLASLTALARFCFG